MSKRVSRIATHGKIALIYLTPRGHAKIDIADIPLASGLLWRKTAKHVHATTEDGKKIKLHRLIARALPQQNVYFWNGDRMDHTRRNLTFGPRK